MAAIDISRLPSSQVFDLSNSAVRNEFIKRYPRFIKMFDVMASEGVIAIKGDIPTEAVSGLIRIPDGASTATIKRLMGKLFGE